MSSLDDPPEDSSLGKGCHLARCFNLSSHNIPKQITLLSDDSSDDHVSCVGKKKPLLIRHSLGPPLDWGHQ